MKKFFVIAALTVAASPVIIDPVWAAPREEVQCRSTDIVDGGFIVTFSADERFAKLEEQTFHGPNLLANMNCKQLPVHQTYPDALNNTLFCSDPRAVDGGLILRRYVGGIAGLDYVKVLAATVFRGRVIENEMAYGNLNCKN